MRPSLQNILLEGQTEKSEYSITFIWVAASPEVGGDDVAQLREGKYDSLDEQRGAT